MGLDPWGQRFDSHIAVADVLAKPCVSFDDNLTKSLEPHPEKFHGMSDEEYRLRHRYLDLVYTPETLERAKQRIKIVRTMRNYFDERGFMEVETPTLHSIAGGAAARPFTTHHN